MDIGLMIAFVGLIFVAEYKKARFLNFGAMIIGFYTAFTAENTFLIIAFVGISLMLLVMTFMDVKG